MRDLHQLNLIGLVCFAIFGVVFVWHWRCAMETQRSLGEELVLDDALLADELIRNDCVKFGSFKLANMEDVSPIYINLRGLMSSMYMRDMALDMFDARLAGEEFDVVADVPTGATAFAAVYAHAKRKPMISPMRKKIHGLSSEISGAFVHGKRVLLIDDVITSGRSALYVIGLLEKYGFEIAAVAVLIDREQGGAELLERRGYKLFSVFKLTAMLSHYKNHGLVSEENSARALEYILNS